MVSGNRAKLLGLLLGFIKCKFQAPIADHFYSVGAIELMEDSQAMASAIQPVQAIGPAPNWQSKVCVQISILTFI